MRLVTRAPGRVMTGEVSVKARVVVSKLTVTVAPVGAVGVLAGTLMINVPEFPDVEMLGLVCPEPVTTPVACPPELSVKLSGRAVLSPELVKT